MKNDDDEGEQQPQLHTGRFNLIKSDHCAIEWALFFTYSDLSLERPKPSDQVSAIMAELSKHFGGV